MAEIPLVSIIMCTYNGERFLDDQVNSILNQDYSNFELIIVDDVSNDNTWLKLKDWQHKSEKIKIFQNKMNVGYNKNFENAIPRALGSFIAISDQDDIWLPKKISKTMKAFSNPEIILAHSKSVRLQANELKYYKADLHYHFNGNDTRKLFFFNQVMGHDMIFKKELVPQILPIPERMSYDWWIAVVATCYGSIAGVDEYLVHHRIHDHNNFFSAGAASKKKELDLDETLNLFARIPAINDEKKSYLHSILQLLKEHKSNEGFDPKLFRFLYRNRKVIFGHKRRMFAEFSYFKNSVKYARLDYTGKGISF